MSRTVRVGGIFATVMGGLLLATWCVLFLRGEVSGLDTAPLETGFLLVAEANTGLTLIAGGYGALTRRRWGMTVLLVGLGMLMYCVVFSIGVFAQQNVAPAVAWFVFVTLSTIALIGALLAQAARTSAY